MNSQTANHHPTSSAALLSVSPLGNIAVTPECAFKTTATPAENATEITWDITAQAIVDNAAQNAGNLLHPTACTILAMFTQEKIEDAASE